MVKFVLLILDWVLTRLQKNPEINVRGEYLLPYGVYRGNNKMYDTHFFLNSLYNSEAYLDESTLKFIRDVLPSNT